MGARASSLIAALQLADSALPIGRFAHSIGLEALLRADGTIGEGELLELVETAVLEGIGPLDGVAVGEAHRRAGRGDLDGLLALDRLVTARKLSPGSRLASASCGRRLAAIAPVLTDAESAGSLARLVRAGEADGNLAVLEGALAQALGIGLEEAILLELRGAAAALLSAAVRLARLTALRAQAVLRALEPALLSASAEAALLPPAAMRASAIELEVHALAHARLDARLFAS